MGDPDPDLIESVRRSLAEDTRAEFERRVRDQADRLRAAIAAGRFENEAYTVGLELEAYAVDGAGRLAAVPEETFGTADCAKELGVHNVEVNTDPTVFDGEGIAAGAADLEERVAAVRSALPADRELVLDGMWTVPPPEGTREYLSAVSVADGVTVAGNMRASPRYCALDTELLEIAGGTVEVDLPGVTLSLPTILAESLTSSIQPHLQVPDTDAFPEHHAVALRTLGPVLALATNSPFLPADLYEGEASRDPHALLDRAHHEHRIAVFERSINVGPESAHKVRFPPEITATSDLVDELVADRTCAPFLKEMVKERDAVDRYADRIWELDHKRGTYWRWLRPVVGGQPVDGAGERSIRLEYRPVPTQPTVADVVGLQCLVSGLVVGLVAADHPITDLDRAAARDCFYDVAENGLDADLAWVDREGDRTGDPDVVYREVFEYARRGLRDRGLEGGAVEEYLDPIEARWRERSTPSRWKQARVRERLDRGDDLRTAIETAQAAYNERSASGTPFAEW